MYMPIFRLLSAGFVLIALTSCGKDNETALKEAEQDAAEQAVADGKIECALAGATSFERLCATERISTERGQLLVIRHPNGGFRRFRVLTDGRGLEPAEGFDPTSIELLENGLIELTSAQDRYRLPARVKGNEAAPAKAR